MTGFGVDVPELRQHATETDGFADHVRAAAEAAAHVTRLDDAYGLIPQLFGLPDVLRGPQEDAARIIAEAAGMLRDTSRNLHDTAQHYADAEKHVEDALDKLAGKLRGAR
jgi:hypothetical protein